MGKYWSSCMGLDPGIQFHDTINSWHTCPNNGEIRASNPCSNTCFWMTLHVT